MTVVKRGATLKEGVVRFSVGRTSSGTGAGCIPTHALANPFKVAPHGPYSREESLAKYELWLEAKILRHDDAVCAALNGIWKAARLGSVELECFCTPLPCYADIVKQVVEEKLERTRM